MEDLFKIVLAGRNEFKVSDTHQNYILNTYCKLDNLFHYNFACFNLYVTAIIMLTAI